MIDHGLLASRQIQGLQAEIAELKQDLIDLRTIMQLPPDARQGFNLTRTENTIFTLLMSREIASREAMMQVLYSHRSEDEPYSNILQVIVSRMRRKLPPWVEIKSTWGRGYSIPPEIKARIRETTTNGVDHERNDRRDHVHPTPSQDQPASTA